MCDMNVLDLIAKAKMIVSIVEDVNPEPWELYPNDLDNIVN